MHRHGRVKATLEDQTLLPSTYTHLHTHTHTQSPPTSLQTPDWPYRFIKLMISGSALIKLLKQAWQKDAANKYHRTSVFLRPCQDHPEAPSKRLPAEKLLTVVLLAEDDFSAALNPQSKYLYGYFPKYFENIFMNTLIQNIFTAPS